MNSEEERAVSGRDLGNDSADEEIEETEPAQDKANNNNDDDIIPRISLIADKRRTEMTIPRIFNPQDDQNITRRVRQPLPRQSQIQYTAAVGNESQIESQIGANDVGRSTQDVRNTAPTPHSDQDKMMELIVLMANVLEKITSNNRLDISITQSPTGNPNSWNDPKDTRRKARKSISSQFAKSCSPENSETTASATKSVS